MLEEIISNFKNLLNFSWDISSSLYLTAQKLYIFAQENKYTIKNTYEESFIEATNQKLSLNSKVYQSILDTAFTEGIILNYVLKTEIKEILDKGNKKLFKDFLMRNSIFNEHLFRAFKPIDKKQTLDFLHHALMSDEKHVEIVNAIFSRYYFNLFEKKCTFHYFSGSKDEFNNFFDFISHKYPDICNRDSALTFIDISESLFKKNGYEIGCNIVLNSIKETFTQLNNHCELVIYIPQIIINGKESDRAVVDALDPSRIENISVLKNENAVKIYGEKAKDGAMIIQLKSTEVQMFSNKDAIGANVKMRLDALNSGDKNWGVKFHSATGGQPLVFIDGEEALGDDPLSNISPDRIRSLSVMKGKQAMAVYGNRGKDGVILVNLKAERKYPNKENLPNPTKIKTESELPKKENTFVIGGPHDAEWHADQTKRMNAALIIIDGKEVKSDAISTLSPERIKSFTVLKDKAAIDAYGEKGKNGVVLITLLTEGEYEFQKNGSKKPYADALELAESVAKGVEGEVIYCIDDDEIRKTKLKGMSAKEIKAVSVDDFGKKKVVRLKTDKYRSDWITVTGEVYGEDGKPTVAIVNVKGTGFMERTDANGHFTIKAPKKGVLLIGYNDKPTIEVKVKSALKVVLKGK